MKKLFKHIIKHPLISSAMTAVTGLVLQQCFEVIQDSIKVEIQTDNYGDHFSKILAWIHHNKILSKSKKIALNRYGEVSTPEGKVWFLYKGHPAFVSLTSFRTEYEIRDVFKLVIFGGNRRMIDQIFAEVGEIDSKKRTIDIKTNEHGHWYKSAARLLRDENTFILKPGQLDYILNDVQWFLSSKEWYRKRGIPYHRGYLFSGPPGTGKTTVISVIASKFNIPVHVINLASIANDADLLKMMVNIKVTGSDDDVDTSKSAIVALEDIDCISVSSNRETQKSKDKGVTLAGVLNALDGMSTPDGVIFVLTTNEPDKLDSALIRPGRVDVHEVFDFLEQPQQQELSKLFYDSPIKGISKPVSASTLQNLFMKYPNDKIAAQKELECVACSNS